MNRTKDRNIDLLSTSPVGPNALPTATDSATPPAAAQPESSTPFVAPPTSDEGFPDETASEAFDLAIQEAIRASTPKRRDLKLVKKKTKNQQGSEKSEFFTVAQILVRADAWHLQYGKWPNENSGPVFDGAEITWCNVDSALRIGSYNLPGGSSLPRLLEAERGARNKKRLPALTPEKVLEWADLHKERTGQWPTRMTGALLEASGENWASLDAALHYGGRGLPGNSSLAVLLEEERGRRHCHHIPPLTKDQILQWADHHHAQTGAWPNSNSGAILASPNETWLAINSALVAGRRSLPRGSSLVSLLMDHRGKRNRKRLPHLSEEQILQWADAYKERHGDWPKHNSGPIEGTQGETWSAVASAFYRGIRGLPGDTTLPRLLAEHRGAPYPGECDPLSITQILAWADAWHLQYGKWPTRTSGPVFEGADTTWIAVQRALARGTRGLSGGSSLARLLETHRGIRNHLILSQLTRDQILEWADLHKERTGQWPTKASGAITNAPDEKWSAVDAALRAGSRSLPGGSSLVILLEEERGHHNRRRTQKRPMQQDQKDLERGHHHRSRTPPLTIEQILAWADAYYALNGVWPKVKTGLIPDTDNVNWAAIDNALRNGSRSLPGGSSLATLLADERGRRDSTRMPPLTETQILQWADHHHAQTGAWPHRGSGPVLGAPGEKWDNIIASLHHGNRSLPGGSSLASLLAAHRGVRHRLRLSFLNEEQILAWADVYKERHGNWPNRESGRIEEAEGETWMGVHISLYVGKRGMPGGSSLARLLVAHRGVSNREALPPLNESRILQWADTYYAQTGKWPTATSGPIADAPGETWSGVNAALAVGKRSLSAGSSLYKFLVAQRGVRMGLSGPERGVSAK